MHVYSTSILYPHLPLYGAAQNGHAAVVEILIKEGADLNKVSHVGCDEVLTSSRRIYPYCIHCLASRHNDNYGH